MATSNSVAERRAKAVARLVEEAQWVGGDYGFKIAAPPAVKDVEIQRIGLLEYAADVLASVRETRLAECSAQAEQAKAEKEAAKAAKAEQAKADAKGGK